MRFLRTLGEIHDPPPPAHCSWNIQVVVYFFTFKLPSQEVCESESCSVVSDSLQPHGLDSPWNSPGQNTGVGNLSLLQGIFPTQGLKPGLPHCRQILYQLSYKGSPMVCTLGKKKKDHGLGFSWWSSGEDSELVMQGAWVQSLVRELDPTCHN